jgi:endonuclease/exonuclease/phosphatase family metal-dependent hydrolase
MQELLDLLTEENKESYIMGDFNIDLLKFSNHNKTNDYLENIFSLGHIPLITKPTRVTTHSATLIDHIYTSKLQEKTKSGIVVTDISDHFGIFTVILSSKKKHRQQLNQIYSAHLNKKILSN